MARYPLTDGEYDARLHAFIMRKCAGNAKVRSNGALDNARAQRRPKPKRFNTAFTFSMTEADHDALLATAKLLRCTVSTLIRTALHKTYLKKG